MEIPKKKIVHLQKSNDKWQTPLNLLKVLDAEFHFDIFDPCPIDWKEGDEDGLKIEWAETTFVNPPFSAVNEWIKKAHEEWQKGKTVVLLMNAKTHISSFHDIVLRNPVEIRFVKGRIGFINPAEPDKKSKNPWSSMILIWRKEKSPRFIDFTFTKKNV